MPATPLLIRSVAGVVLVICATVTLGISAHVENSSRTFGVKTSVFTYGAFVGAFTLLAELVFVGLRLTQKVGLLSELIVASLVWVFWIASAIVTTKYTEEDRSICRNLDNLFGLPELEGLDQNDLAQVKKIFKSACRELHAELAFLWIGFIVITFIVGYILVLALRHHTKGNKSVWKTTLVAYKSASVDPFADPQGNERGPTVGVPRPVDPNMEIHTGR